MAFPSDRYLQQRPELVRDLSQKLEISRDCLRDKFAYDDPQPDLSANLDVLERRSDLSDPNLDMFSNSGMILSQDWNLKGCNGMFQLLNVEQFRREEIETKVVGDLIVVHGKHDDRFDEHAWTSREFTRRFKIPEDVDLFTVRSVMNNGVLVITASKKIAKLAGSERIKIQIEIEVPY